MNVIQCPSCDRRLKLPSELAGKNLRCPYCKSSFTVPAAPPVAPDLPPIPVISSRTSKSPPPSPDPVHQAQPTVAKRQMHLPVPSRRKRAPEPPPAAPLSKSGLHIDHEELIDMTAMVDIVFFLLIFFLVTSMAGIMSSAKLPRPENQDEEGGQKTQQVQDPQSDANAITVKINKDDSMDIDGVPYHDINDLIVRLRQLRTSGGADTALLVVGHGEATHGAAVAVLDAAYEVGIDRLRLAVTGGEPE